jgi:hypothetical protein
MRGWGGNRSTENVSKFLKGGKIESKRYNKENTQKSS